MFVLFKMIIVYNAIQYSYIYYIGQHIFNGLLKFNFLDRVVGSLVE